MIDWVCLQQEGRLSEWGMTREENRRGYVHEDEGRIARVDDLSMQLRVKRLLDLSSSVPGRVHTPCSPIPHSVYCRKSFNKSRPALPPSQFTLSKSICILVRQRDQVWRFHLISLSLHIHSSSYTLHALLKRHHTFTPLAGYPIHQYIIKMRGEHCVAGASILTAIAVILMVFANIGQISSGAVTNGIYWVELNVEA
jgi:hypothetical protein